MKPLESQQQREKPYKFITKALKTLKNRGGSVIVEIGSTRVDLNHDINDIQSCCNDGHSSVHFAMFENAEFFSIDIDATASNITINNLKNKNLYTHRTRVLTLDGIAFLNEFKGKIDLLFLDGWDVNFADSAEKHLEAFKAAENKLTRNSLILIDDTDVDYKNGEFFILEENESGGKGKLLIPYLKSKGYTVILSGRQTMLSL